MKGRIWMREEGFTITYLYLGTGVPLMFHEDGGTSVLRIIDMY
jgi:hypothetical protein